MFFRNFIKFIIAVIVFDIPVACKNQEIVQGQSPLVLPIPHSNNATAIAISKDGPTLYSFNGLRAGKGYQDVSKMVFACPIEKTCRQLDDVPVSEGRLASIAVTLKNKIYLFGGYSVAADGTEVSTPETLQFDPMTESWGKLSPMPVPVDDAVAFGHDDRYIYLVSGWHNDGNVSLVQVYDVIEDRWFRATDYPGRPVFGHAGGIVDGKIVIADGVAVIGEEGGRRQFGEVNEVWLGTINPEDPANIRWRTFPAHPYGPLYRMAAMGDDIRKQIIFAGGGDNPYNINGVGYDGVPAKPSEFIFAFDLRTETWIELGHLSVASMDHRALLKAQDHYYIMGGMNAELMVRAQTTRFTLEKEKP